MPRISHKREVAAPFENGQDRIGRSEVHSRESLQRRRWAVLWGVDRNAWASSISGCATHSRVWSAGDRCDGLASILLLARAWRWCDDASSAFAAHTTVDTRESSETYPKPANTRGPKTRGTAREACVEGQAAKSTTVEGRWNRSTADWLRVAKSLPWKQSSTEGLSKELSRLMRFPSLQVLDLHRISCGRQLQQARWQGNRLKLRSSNLLLKPSRGRTCMGPERAWLEKNYVLHFRGEELWDISLLCTTFEKPQMEKKHMKDKRLPKVCYTPKVGSLIRFLSNKINLWSQHFWVVCRFSLHEFFQLRSHDLDDWQVGVCGNVPFEQYGHGTLARSLDLCWGFEASSCHLQIPKLNSFFSVIEARNFRCRFFSSWWKRTISYTCTSLRVLVYYETFGVVVAPLEPADMGRG